MPSPLAFSLPMALAVIEGRKIATTRRATNSLFVGQEVLLKWPSRFGIVFGAGVITLREEGFRPLERAEEVFAQEGFSSPEAYIDCLRGLHPDKRIEDEAWVLLRFDVTSLAPVAVREIERRAKAKLGNLSEVGSR